MGGGAIGGQSINGIGSVTPCWRSGLEKIYTSLQAIAVSFRIKDGGIIARLLGNLLQAG
jgi:hypothetical protein